MTQFQVRVITNGYILSYMDGNELLELCFTDRPELFDHITENLSLSAWEIKECEDEHADGKHYAMLAGDFYRGETA